MTMAASHSKRHLKKSLGQLLGYGNDDVGTIGDDCLNMNIVTPPPPQAPAEAAAAAAAAPPPAAAPVLVWVHGGANANGSNSQLTHLYPSSDFAKRGVREPILRRNFIRWRVVVGMVVMGSRT